MQPNQPQARGSLRHSESEPPAPFGSNHALPHNGARVLVEIHVRPGRQRLNCRNPEELELEGCSLGTRTRLLVIVILQNKPLLLKSTGPRRHLRVARWHLPAAAGQTFDSEAPRQV